MMVLTHEKCPCVFCYYGIIFRFIKLYTHIAGFNDDNNPLKMFFCALLSWNYFKRYQVIYIYYRN